jgi:hypothetical protein
MDDTEQQKLTAEVESFLRASGMSPSAFGHEAVTDRGFVFDLRKGRRVWPETADKVRRFIRERSEATASQ